LIARSVTTSRSGLHAQATGRPSAHGGGAAGVAAGGVAGSEIIADERHEHINKTYEGEQAAVVGALGIRGNQPIAPCPR